MTLKAAIIGRPNVGKSTLFNRLVGRRLALVDDQPGVTRDRREGDGRIGALEFRVVDTAGLDEGEDESLTARMQAQTEAAIAEADLCLFLIDARVGVTPHDRHFASILRRAGKPVVLLANKAEGRAAESGLYEAYALGLGEPIALSAEHGEGLDALHDRIQEQMASAGIDVAGDGDATDDEEGGSEETVLRLAVTGRPNTGKSTLINRLIGEERLLTGPEAGITRDAIAIEWRWRSRPVRLFDTAGLRRKSRVVEKLEKLSVADALRAIRFAEVVVVVIDAENPLEKQDLQIADMTAREGRALVIAVNKWDLVSDTRAARSDIEEAVDRLLPQMRGVAVIPLSARTGEGVDRLMPAVLEAYERWQTRIPTARLNRWLAEMIERHPPPAPGGRRIKLRYMTQVKARPPTFVAFSARADALPDSYRRYLIQGLREAFELWGVPLRLTLRKGENPYD